MNRTYFYVLFLLVFMVACETKEPQDALPPSAEKIGEVAEKAPQKRWYQRIWDWISTDSISRNVAGGVVGTAAVAGIGAGLWQWKFSKDQAKLWEEVKNGDYDSKGKDEVPCERLLDLYETYLVKKSHAFGVKQEREAFIKVHSLRYGRGEEEGELKAVHGLLVGVCDYKKPEDARIKALQTDLGTYAITRLDFPTDEPGKAFLKRAKQLKLEDLWPVPDTDTAWDKLVFLSYVNNPQRNNWLTELKALCDNFQKEANTPMTRVMLMEEDERLELYKNSATQALAEFVIRVLPFIEKDKTLPQTHIQCQVKP